MDLVVLFIVVFLNNIKLNSVSFFVIFHEIQPPPSPEKCFAFKWKLLISIRVYVSLVRLFLFCFLLIFVLIDLLCNDLAPPSVWNITALISGTVVSPLAVSISVASFRRTRLCLHVHIA
ncbi:hypothetical protein EGW08_001783 [Elysia chlorotica]|uniref:Transmembrane protein n=1 Tax=Elysia chlorotica TaxID=188477 RepID=A0A433U9G2_ELYCH|nr:hypothetical protein EGW08_001783 [Elysia chlorotica]